MLRAWGSLEIAGGRQLVSRPPGSEQWAPIHREVGHGELHAAVAGATAICRPKAQDPTFRPDPFHCRSGRPGELLRGPRHRHPDGRRRLGVGAAAAWSHPAAASLVPVLSDAAAVGAGAQIRGLVRRPAYLARQGWWKTWRRPHVGKE